MRIPSNHCPRILGRYISVGGGAPVTIVGAGNPYGVEWETDGSILYGQQDGIWRVADSGGTPELVIPVEDGELVHGPRLLPDGEWVLFTFRPAGVSQWDEAQIVAQSLTTRERMILVTEGRDGRYVDSGHLVYGLNGVILAVPFEPERREVLGGPVSLIDGVRQAQVNSGAMYFAVTDSGTAVYAPGDIESGRSLMWVDRGGRAEVLEIPANSYLGASVSPSGRHAAVGITNVENPDIYVADLDRGTLTRVTTDAGDDRFPIWSPDGQSVVFTSTREGRVGLFRKAADGTGAAELLVLFDESVTDVGANNWTPDGAAIVVEVEANLDRHIGLVSLDTPDSWVRVIDSEAREFTPAISPDGRWIAYSSDETGRSEIYVQRFPELGQRRPISTNGGHSPQWSSDGSELYYLHSLNGPPLAMIAVPIESGDTTLTPGLPEEWFTWQYFSVFRAKRRYDLSPTDGRFLVLGDAASTLSGNQADRSERLTIVLNWVQELVERVPIP